MKYLVWKLIFSVILLSLNGSHSMHVTPSNVSRVRSSLITSTLTVADHIASRAKANRNGINQPQVKYRISVVSYPEVHILGQKFTLECRLNYEPPKPQYLWFKDGHLIEYGKQLPFEILKVDNFGSYKCVVFGVAPDGAWIELESTIFQLNSTNHRQETGKPFELTMGSAIDITPIGDFEMFVQYKPLEPRIGYRFSVQCDVFPELMDTKYSWFRGGHLIHNQQILPFSRFRIEDLGSYKCAAWGYANNGRRVEVEESVVLKTTSNMNSKGTSFSASDRVQKDQRKSKHSISIQSSPEYPIIGRPLKMDCIVTPGLKNVKYSWFKNGHFVANIKSMVFTRLTLNDFGTYKCVASGDSVDGVPTKLDATIIQKETEYIIRYSDYPVSITSTPNTPRLGEKHILHCTVAGDLRDVEYEWYKNGKHFVNQQTLSFDSLLSGDKGQYMCIVRGRNVNGTPLLLKGSNRLNIDF